MKRLAFITVALAACVVANAQYSSNFEAPTYAGSAAGTLATGQDGWYNPVAGSVDANIYTYAGNALGFSTNPFGGSQFVGLLAGGPAAQPSRVQHDVTLFAGMNTMTFDFNGKYNGTLPAVDNLGSASLQPSATANYFQTIYQWGTNTALADKYNANIGVFGPGGGAITFTSPGAAWVDLVPDHWYRQSVTWDTVTNTITETTLMDLTVGGPLNTANPSGWYLSGGAANTLGLPTATSFRFFAGGVNDAMAYDNLSIVPEPATLAVLAAGLVGAALRRRRK